MCNILVIQIITNTSSNIIEGKKYLKNVGLIFFNLYSKLPCAYSSQFSVI